MAPQHGDHYAEVEGLRDICPPPSAEKETEASPAALGPHPIGPKPRRNTHAYPSCEAHRDTDQPQWSHVACPGHPLGTLPDPRPSVLFLSPPASPKSQVRLDLVPGGVACVHMKSIECQLGTRPCAKAELTSPPSVPTTPEPMCLFYRWKGSDVEWPLP